MRRREFIRLIGGAVVAWPLSANAQELGRVYRLGILNSATPNAPHHVAFYKELERLGFTAGKNLLVDWAGYGLSSDKFAEHAAQLVKTQVDIIHAGGDAAVRAAQQVTSTIPIHGLADDMLGQGFVRSLSRPGGNTTGVSIVAGELDAKRQDILIEALPGLHRLAALVDANTTAPRQLANLTDAARARGIELSLHRVTASKEIAPAINAAKETGAGALNVLASPLFFNSRPLIFERTAALLLPAIYQWPEMAEQGGLMGYGPSIVQLYRDVMARQLVQLLRGTKPADLPVEQPTKFEMVINLKLARAIGVELPTSILLRADEVIE
jgi:putative tryptophan/tyrosine transport system substrate-binding protein